MANSYDIYAGDGATTQFVVTFDFISRDHVTLLVDGVSVSFSWVNDGLVQAAVAPALGTVVKVKRSSSPTVALVDFTAGYLSEEDLDTAYLHTFYLAQEAVDVANGSIALNDSNLFDATSHRIVNVANAVDTNDAVNKSQLDAVVAAAGNVPTPSDPTDDGKVLAADSGAFSWTSFLISMISDASAFIKTLLASADATAARTNLDVPQTTRAINTGSGLTGGGNLSSDRTLSIDIPSLTADATPDVDADYVITYDASAAGLKKSLLSSLGCPVKLEHQDASNSASITFNLLQYAGLGFRNFRVLVESMHPQNDASEFYATVSPDGGSTFTSAGYKTASYGVSTAAISRVSGATTAQWRLNPGTTLMGNGSGEAAVYDITIINPYDAAQFPMIDYTGSYNSSAPSMTAFKGGGVLTTAQKTDQIKFAIDSGNIVSGRFTLYGMP